MATALEIAQEISSVSGFHAPSTLLDQNDPLANSLLLLLNRGCSAMARKRGPFGQSWPFLVKALDLAVQEDVRSYALPLGFQELVPDTLWDESSHTPSRGSLTPQEWQAYRFSTVGDLGLLLQYRIVSSDSGAPRIEFDPVPATSRTLSLEYVSRYWAKENAGSELTLEKIVQDTQIPAFDEELVALDLEWRFKKSRGLSFSVELAEFEMERDRRFAQAIGTTDISFSSKKSRLGSTDLGPIVTTSNDDDQVLGYEE